MTDLVQKIADAVEPWIDSPLVGRERNQFHEAIRAALADAGGAVAWMIDGEPMLEHEVRSTDAESRNDLLARAIPLFLHPTPDAGRVTELRSQADHNYRTAKALADRYAEDQARIAALESQLAESARCAFEYAAKVGELERQLAESREREGRMREALELCEFALEPYDDVKPRDWKSDREKLAVAHRAAVKALAAEKE